MKKILAFAGSNSSKSINQSIVNYLGNNFDLTAKSIAHFDLPIYSSDIEERNGIPTLVGEFIEEIKTYDGIIIAVNEHNGYMSAFFKNLLDWMSRKEMKSMDGKSVMVMSVSPGGGGGASANKAMQTIVGYFGGNLVDSMKIGGFYDAFEMANGTFNNKEVEVELSGKVRALIES